VGHDVVWNLIANVVSVHVHEGLINLIIREIKMRKLRSQSFSSFRINWFLIRCVLRDKFPCVTVLQVSVTREPNLHITFLTSYMHRKRCKTCFRIYKMFLFVYKDSEINWYNIYKTVLTYLLMRNYYYYCSIKLLNNISILFIYELFTALHNVRSKLEISKL